MNETSTAPLLVDRIRHHAKTIPRALAVRAPGGERTMAELADRAEQIAARLREAGCRPGDRIAVFGHASLAWLDVMVGAMFARCAFAPFSTSLTPAEQRDLLADAGPRLIFADSAFAGQGRCPAPITIELEALDAWLVAGIKTSEPDLPQGDDLFSIIYSSGTTGVPKGIAHSASARAEFIHARPRPGFGPGRTGYVSTAPYTNFSFLGMITPLYWGAAVSVPARFSVEGFISACADERITDVSLVPVQVKRVLEHPAFDPTKIASLQFTMISGSPLERSVKEELIEHWPGRIVDSYGTTETGGIATLDLKAFPDKLDTVGRILDGVDPVILDEDGQPLPAGHSGEIAAVTPMPMDRYFNRDDLTAQSIWRDAAGRRFIRTGDVGFIGEDGFLRITGRSKDMIISGGLNVFAIDIETVLCAHPAVAEAAVIAVPDERWGESPYAVVALRKDTGATSEELMEWMQSRLARPCWPRGIKLVAALPRNDMGKILKRDLREPFWRGRVRGVA
jgi:acyl-CoA synthetase (AMP-forming)/AMP-acid ligase II